MVLVRKMKKEEEEEEKKKKYFTVLVTVFRGPQKKLACVKENMLLETTKLIFLIQLYVGIQSMFPKFYRFISLAAS